MDDIQRQLDENKLEHKELMSDIKEIKDGMADIKIMIAKLPEKFDERYATKRLEIWFYSAVGIVLLAIITGLLNLILK